MPGTQFVTDFARLITDVDQLLVDVGGITRKAGERGKSNGQAQKLRLSDTISALREHAQFFVEAGRRKSLLERPTMLDLIVNLGRVRTVESMAEVVGVHCRKAYGSPAAVIFAERDGALQLVSRWNTGQILSKYLSEEMVKNGAAARAFRAGEPALWSRRNVARTAASRYLQRLLQRFRCRSVIYLPISVPGGPPAGVLAIVLPHLKEYSPSEFDEFVRLGQIVSGHFLLARALEEAQAARVKAEDVVRNRDEFISMLSHELKNPMMPILGWAVALTSGTLPREKQNVALEGIVKNVKMMNRLIEDLFDGARISSGKLRLQLAETRIQDVAREALTSIQGMTESKKLRISTDISEAIPPFIADFRRLYQVLINLLNNAVKFTPAGGTVSLQVRRRDNKVECIVSDTGKGIERKSLPLIFERFRQGTRPSKVHAAGLGLGLAIVREIVKLHGGAVEAFSEGTDKGSTFAFWLPLRRAQVRYPSGSREKPAD
jgi:signal transduction histidine kinase